MASLAGWVFPAGNNPHLLYLGHIVPDSIGDGRQQRDGRTGRTNHAQHQYAICKCAYFEVAATLLHHGGNMLLQDRLDG